MDMTHVYLTIVCLQCEKVATFFTAFLEHFVLNMNIFIAFKVCLILNLNIP